jgi:hypothetical protein
MSSNIWNVNDCLAAESLRGYNRKSGAVMNKDQVYSVDQDCLKNKIQKISFIESKTYQLAEIHKSR